MIDALRGGTTRALIFFKGAQKVQYLSGVGEEFGLK